MPSEQSLQVAAQCWCDDETKDLEMDPALAKAFAKRLDLLFEALVWCGGSYDFCPEGKSREGWKKIVEPLLRGQFDVTWRSMETAPRDGTTVEVRQGNREGDVVKAHYAQDLSGEEQSLFKGWFVQLSEHEFAGVNDPVAWRPIAETVEAPDADKHRPVPVEAARRISEQYRKSMVVILSYDPVSELTHTTTYGVGPEDKETAADVGDQCSKMICGEGFKQRKSYEDYRFLDQGKLVQENERLKKIVGCVVRTCSRFDYHLSEEESGPLCGSTWHKVSYVCGLGSTSATELCREYGVDPHYDCSQLDLGDEEEETTESECEVKYVLEKERQVVFQFDERSMETFDMFRQLHPSARFAQVVLRDPETGHERTLTLPT